MRVEILLSDTKFMNTCSFIIHCKNISACSMLFVECIMCYGELKEASTSSSQQAPLTFEAFLTAKKLKRAYIENFQSFVTLDSQDPTPYGDTNFIACRNLVSPSLISHTHY